MIPTTIPYREVLRDRAKHLATRAVQAGRPDRRTGPLDEPVTLSSAFRFETAEIAQRACEGDSTLDCYGRWSSPNVRALEEAIASLEETESACVVSSGMAAVAGVFLTLLKSGDHVVLPRAVYAETSRLFRDRLAPLGIQHTAVDAGDLNAIRSAITDTTRVLYVETPANPNLAITDLTRVIALAHEVGALAIVDNTFASPFCQTPRSFGADLVLHSMTKSLCGHGDAIGGAVCGEQGLVSKIRDGTVRTLGGMLSPIAAHLILRGIRTFPQRQAWACESAAYLAERLATHPLVSRVFHPSLKSDPGHALARAQMHAYGSLLSLELAGDVKATPLDRGRRLAENVKCFAHAVSLGDAHSLVIHPASTTHVSMPKKAREEAHIGDGLLRLSVGLEDPDALWEDLRRALG